MPTIAIGGNEIAFDIQGSGDETMLFVHGIGTDSSVWKNQMAYFSPRFRCISFDWKGFGDSKLTAPKSIYTIESLTKEFGSICNELNITSETYIVAHDAGVMVVLKADIDDILRCKGIVAINATEKFKIKLKAKQFVKNFKDGSKIKLVEKMALKEAFEKHIDKIDVWLKAFSSIDLSANTEFIETPIEFVISKQTAFVTVKDAEATVKKIPRSKVVVQDGQDYNMIQFPDQMNKEIDEAIEYFAEAMKVYKRG
jgi:pimeloyl-ACP methyl ester carboxylesterase